MGLAEQERDWRRLAAMAVVAGLHVAVIYGFLQWNLRPERMGEPAPMQVALFTEEEAPRPALPPLPVPEYLTPTVMIEPPEIRLPRFDEPSQAITATVAVAHRSEASQPTRAPASQPKLISTVEYLKPLQPQYPSLSRRLREEGLVVLLVLIDEKGFASSVQVRDSSGHERLDRAASEAARCARFKPYVEDGVARPAFVLIPVEFSLGRRVAQR